MKPKQEREQNNMTPQQYDKINGLDALGGCLGFLCVIGIFPVVSIFTGSFILGLGALAISVVGVAVLIAAAKEKV